MLGIMQLGPRTWPLWQLIHLPLIESQCVWLGQEDTVWFWPGATEHT